LIDVAVVGVSGFTGLELLKILSSHPEFNIRYMGASRAYKSITDIHPSLSGVIKGEVRASDVKEIALVSKLVFLALPHKSSMEFVKDLLELGVKVVDLSADYRLKASSYEKHYCTHIDKKNLKNSIYGLPELFRDEIKEARLVANPGCYPTATILALLPFLPYLDDSYPVMVDAKSGVSGAGKKCSDSTHYVSINENCFSYSPLTHRHAPEIKEKLGIDNLTFVPHLLPTTRGMLVSCYLLLKEDIDVESVLNNRYRDELFVRVFKEPVDIKSSGGTNFCDLFVKSSGRTLFVSSSIDNLLRGASSQAVVNANLMSGFSEDLGIPKLTYRP
jgi:N-acetyl-gamma-glutamyl-phosphate reductase